MSGETIARWQFGITTVYHFLFVPLTIGLSLTVASMQTVWVRTRNPDWLRLTRFWGKLMLINFAMGVVTGIVQEFQFGMNWSDYSRFVGDVFGAPLAMEALVAFFLESTFLGLWIFGWDRLPRRVHLATIWLAAGGTVISAYFILAANSWMQHPVGYRINPDTGRAELTSIWKVLTNSTQLVTFPHVLAASLVTAGAVLMGLSAWHLRRGHQVELHRKVARLAVGVTIVASLATMGFGHLQAQVMTKQQPMKMASAEALWTTETNAPFSLFAYGDVNDGQNKIDIKVPGLLSFLATNSPNGEVRGVTDVAAQEQDKYGPGDYTPVMGVTYWTFRLMMGFGGLSLLLAAAFGYWLRRTRRPAAAPTAVTAATAATAEATETAETASPPARPPAGEEPSRWSRLLLLGVVWGTALPYLANSAGWIFTEMGRQPWLVFGLLRTADGVSPGVSTAMALVTVIGFTALYGALAVVALRLFLRHGRADIPELPRRGGPADGTDTGSGSGSDGVDRGDADDDLDRLPALAY
ncbi:MULTISPECIES: cytochrome ubiquinol oxidase subunit I [Pseudofrankia]|uniref:cytochrome ubiquinol oxidase subunit I n=1 Tax=Pseudofrankia TaxID=2994363 RepID=UPI000234D3F8|nr:MULTISPECIES: cytochrome ubiquinol oxidase subunit I [Pseudofrankia]